MSHWRNGAPSQCALSLLIVGLSGLTGLAACAPAGAPTAPATGGSSVDSEHNRNGSGSHRADQASEEASEEASTQTHLALHTSAFTDFYFLMRAEASGAIDPSGDLESVVQAWRPVQEVIGSFGGYWRFDLPALLRSDPAAYGASFEQSPETVERRGLEVPLRGPGLEMAAAMDAPWERFRTAAWPDRERQIQRAITRLEEEFLPRHREAMAHMMSSLAIPDPEVEIPVFLVLDMQSPGASTYSTRGGTAVALSIRHLLGQDRFGDLEETLLHESCHALEPIGADSRDAFSRMRAALRERGIERSDPRYHDVPHLIMFIQAENTMRRLFDPDHVAYGDTRRGDARSLYERQGPIAQVARDVWAAYLDGTFDLDEAIRRIADQA